MCGEIGSDLGGRMAKRLAKRNRVNRERGIEIGDRGSERPIWMEMSCSSQTCHCPRSISPSLYSFAIQSPAGCRLRLAGAAFMDSSNPLLPGDPVEDSVEMSLEMRPRHEAAVSRFKSDARPHPGV